MTSRLLGPIADSAGLLGDKKTAQDILDGTYYLPEVTKPHTRSMIKLLQWKNTILDAVPIKTMVIHEGFILHWKIACEYNSYSISYVHFGHYNSVSKLEFLSKVHALFSNISAHMGKPLSHWSKCLHVMIPKDPGKPRVKKLRVTLLI